MSARATPGPRSSPDARRSIRCSRTSRGVSRPAPPSHPPPHLQCRPGELCRTGWLFPCSFFSLPEESCKTLSRCGQAGFVLRGSDEREKRSATACSLGRVSQGTAQPHFLSWLCLPHEVLGSEWDSHTRSQERPSLESDPGSWKDGLDTVRLSVRPRAQSQRSPGLEVCSCCRGHA